VVVSRLGGTAPQPKMRRNDWKSTNTTKTPEETKRKKKRTSLVQQVFQRVVHLTFRVFPKREAPVSAVIGKLGVRWWAAARKGGVNKDTERGRKLAKWTNKFSGGPYKRFGLPDQRSH